MQSCGSLTRPRRRAVLIILIIIVALGWSSALALAGLPVEDIPPLIFGTGAMTAAILERLGCITGPARRHRSGTTRLKLR